ncbi:integrase core domain-containing protein [Halomonas vilamensis]|uniref:Integrase core domain-containing protein n=1 Tax=Vreelandella vilamensis TaxID=531309 RepID=A0ABU1H9D2_9GAMM|nr:integrase core domain-containing protein [Halomonas vilamensis]MDR5900471.1 integrase core domain-containing protein [Halomonas vilamensis]
MLVIVLFLCGFGGFLLGNQYGHYRRLSPLLPWYLSAFPPRPITVIQWFHRQIQLIWHYKSVAGKCRGRPLTPVYVEDWILTIHRENPGYSCRRIAALLRHDLKRPIDKNNVARILKKHGFSPPPSDRSRRYQQEPTWRTFLNNHNVCGMDFKTTFDIYCRQVFILNIVDHHRRRLIWSRATYNPTAQWIAQQLREAFPFDDAQGRIMVMDRDTAFSHVAKHTLPGFGMQVRRTSYRSPWQNGVVERFNRTLQEELLDYLVPLGLRHLNQRLTEYRHFYNTARPHMTNGGDPPVISDGNAANDSNMSQEPERYRLKSVQWVGGLHHSYRLNAA